MKLEEENRLLKELFGIIYVMSTTEKISRARTQKLENMLVERLKILDDSKIKIILPKG